jgi:hypothetical protein
MAKTKLQIIKPALGFTQMSDGDLLARLNAVHDSMSNNPNYPSPPIDMPGFKAAIDAFTAAAAAALNDGGKLSIVERDKRRKDAIIMFRLLGHYVEGACKNDMTTFVSSGFAVDPGRPKTPAGRVSAPLIVAVNQGLKGQLVIHDQKGRECPALRTPLRGGPRCRSYGKLDDSNRSQHEAADTC